MGEYGFQVPKREEQELALAVARIAAVKTGIEKGLVVHFVRQEDDHRPFLEL